MAFDLMPVGVCALTPEQIHERLNNGAGPAPLSKGSTVRNRSAIVAVELGMAAATGEAGT